MKRPFQFLLAGFVLLGSFAMGAVWVEDVQEDRAQEVRLAERSQYAPPDTVEMGPMPSELRESS